MRSSSECNEEIVNNLNQLQCGQQHSRPDSPPVRAHQWVFFQELNAPLVYLLTSNATRQRWQVEVLQSKIPFGSKSIFLSYKKNNACRTTRFPRSSFHSSPAFIFRLPLSVDAKHHPVTAALLVHFKRLDGKTARRSAISSQWRRRTTC